MREKEQIFLNCLFSLHELFFSGLMRELLNLSQLLFLYRNPNGCVMVQADIGGSQNGGKHGFELPTEGKIG